MDEETIDFSFKILLLGNTTVGKSSILERYCKERFESTTFPTIGQDNERKTVIKDGKTINLQIYDTAGQERYRVIAKNLYKGADGILLIYDISNKETFDSMENWIQDITKRVDLLKVAIIIIGNKCDLYEEKEGMEELNENKNLDKDEEKNCKLLNEYVFITDEMKNNFIKDHNFEIIETSAKYNLNIDESFDRLIEKMIILKQKEKLELNNKNENITLEKNKSFQNKKKICCCC